MIGIYGFKADSNSKPTANSTCIHTHAKYYINYSANIKFSFVGISVIIQKE
jgi:hypothetical protein